MRSNRSWRDLEARADPSPFQGWTWVGCRAGERYPDPVLLQVEEAGRIVALALCNRRRAPFAPDTLYLGESGRPELDAVFVELNGPLIERGRETELLGPCLEALLTATLDGRRRGRAVVLSGVPAPVRMAARRLPAAWHERSARAAPFLDLTTLGTGDGLARCSASTRYQVRRSLRLYGALGVPEVRRAETAAQALAWLDALAAWHQATWTRRGRPGAFASPTFVRFHRDLIGRGVARGEVDLLAIAFGRSVIGYLYNLRAGGRVCAYQSGFDYPGAAAHQKPGLTCHHLAIEFYRALGLQAYDFLAGDDRYKNSLAGRRYHLFWAELTAARSLRGIWLASRAAAGGVITRLCTTRGPGNTDKHGTTA